MQLVLCFHFYVGSACQDFLNILATELLAGGQDSFYSHCIVRIAMIRQCEDNDLYNKSIILLVYPSCFLASPFMEMAQLRGAWPIKFRFWGWTQSYWINSLKRSLLHILSIPRNANDSLNVIKTRQNFRCHAKFFKLQLAYKKPSLLLGRCIQGVLLP